jgi:uncharacterized protein YyaL (SSP411 family)
MGVIARAMPLVLSMFLLSPPLFAGSMSKQYQPNLEMGVCKAMTRAADFLLKVQKPGEDGEMGWSWVVGEGNPSANVAGMAALALLDAHQVSGNADYLKAATRYALGLMNRMVEFSGDNLPYKADIEFLSRLADVTKNDGYREAARKMFEFIRKKSPKGGDEVARIADGRKRMRLLGFDVALAIRAAHAVGEKRYAFELADEVLNRMSSWYRLSKDPRFALVSSAALAGALQTLDAGHYRKQIHKFRSDLLRYQQKNGSFLVNETQPSAYAIMALMDSSYSRQRRAARRAVDWLKSTMLKKGAFASYNDYMPEPFVGQVISEVHAEALSALSRACGAKSSGK